MEYVSLTAQPEGTLRWRRADGSGTEFRLTDEAGLLYASIRWEARSRPQAIGITAAGSWVLDRHGGRHLLDFQGHMQPRISIQSEGQEKFVEIPLGNQETLTLGGPNSFGWLMRRETGVHQLLHGAYTSQPGGQGQPLVTTKAVVRGQDIPEAEVRIDPAAIGLPEVSALVLTSFYGMRNGCAG